MDPAEIFISPPLVMAYALLLCWLMYAWAKTIAPPSVPTPDKILPYVGGEYMEGQTCHPGYQFFYVALFFTVVHVAALIIATAPPDAPLAATLGYLAIMAFGVAILRWEQ